LHEDPAGAADAEIAALVALDRHPEASAWFRATLIDTAARTAIVGGLLFLAIAGVGAAAGLVHPLAQRLGLPSASAAALLGALMLLPAAAGEGALGVALAAPAARGGRGSARRGARVRGAGPGAREHRGSRRSTRRGAGRALGPARS